MSHYEILLCADCMAWQEGADATAFCDHQTTDECKGTRCEDIMNAPGLDWVHEEADHYTLTYEGEYRFMYYGTCYACDRTGEFGDFYYYTLTTYGKGNK